VRPRTFPTAPSAIRKRCRQRPRRAEAQASRTGRRRFSTRHFLNMPLGEAASGVSRSPRPPPTQNLVTAKIRGHMLYKNSLPQKQAAPDLDAHAENIRSLLGVTDDDDAREQRRVICNAQETAACCAKCARALKSAEPIWRESLSLGRGWFGGWRTTVAPVCQSCASEWSTYHPPSPCEGCGRPVHNEKTFRVRFLTFCCERCRRRAQASHAREQRCSARSTRTCGMCGETFEPARTDAKFCSPRCKQKAYRQRVTSEAVS
jgi:hypothetical protein